MERLRLSGRNKHVAPVGLFSETKKWTRKRFWNIFTFIYAFKKVQIFQGLIRLLSSLSFFIFISAIIFIWFWSFCLWGFWFWGFLRFQKFFTVFYSDFDIFYKISSFTKKTFFFVIFLLFGSVSSSPTLTIICLFFVFLERFSFVSNFFFFHSILCPILAWLLFLSCFSYSNQPLTRLIAVTSFARLVAKSRETEPIALCQTFPSSSLYLISLLFFLCDVYLHLILIWRIHSPNFTIFFSSFLGKPRVYHDWNYSNRILSFAMFIQNRYIGFVPTFGYAYLQQVFQIPNQFRLHWHANKIPTFHCAYALFYKFLKQIV